MLDYCYETISDLSGFLVLSAVILQLLPGKEYRKYIRFYLGLVLISLVLGPILKLKEVRLPELEKDSYEFERELGKLEMEYAEK